MSISGELSITLSRPNSQLDCQINSTRPMQASNIFTGKSITQTLTTLPLLFNICSKAQSVTAVRAIESAKQISANSYTESTREALITLESLREQSLRVAMDWPAYINEQVDNKLLSHIALGINQLMQTLDTKMALAYQAHDQKHTSNQNHHWENFSKVLSHTLFGISADKWLESVHQDQQLEEWTRKQHTQIARVIHWLNHKEWKNAGKSSITHIPDINDDELLDLLVQKEQRFTAQPSWNNQCYELSWFSRQQKARKPSDGTKNNGLYARMVARPIEIANLIVRLDTFFIHNKAIEATKSTAIGMAHSDAARGRLTHYVEVENETIEKLLILAPTEWNFHPKGVAAESLNNLDAENERDLHQQANLLVHSIDPCVAYQLTVEKI